MPAPNEMALPALYAVRECAADVVAWHLPAGPRLSVVGKVAFAIASGEISELLAPPEIVDRERHHDRSPVRSVEAASDLAPLLPRAEVLIVGSAYVPQGRQVAWLDTQLQIARKNDVLLKKKVRVLGDRATPDAQPAPFARMPLVWERALKTDANPVGADARAKQPNLVDPIDPARAAGFAPISAYWPERRARLKEVPRSATENEPIVLPAGFDFSYFQAAPDDQQLTSLSGNEWIALDGMHPALARLQFRLPACTLAVRLVDPNGKPEKVTAMLADRLVLDVDRMVGTLTFRAAITADWRRLGAHRVEVGLSMKGDTISFPSVRDPSTLRGRRREAASSLPIGETIAAPPSSRGEALPFSSRRPSVSVPVAPPSSASSLKPSETMVADPTIDDAETAVPSRQFTAGAPVVPFVAPTSSPAGPPAALPPVQPPPIQPPPIQPPPIQPPLQLSPVPERVIVKPAGALSLGETRPPESMTRSIEIGRLAERAVPFAGAIEPGVPSAATSSLGVPFTPTNETTATGPILPNEPPPRKSLDVVPTISDAGFAVMTFAWQIRPPQESLVVVVKGSFDLVPNDAAKLRPESELPVGDVFVDDDCEKGLVRASDFAILKPETDVLVTGDAYPPGGRGTATQIALRMRTGQGVLERVVAVFGDRIWQGGAMHVLPSNPEPFEKMPLSYERAFGGPSYATNPVGVGHKGGAGSDGAARLPNFEIPQKLVKSPGDAPPPAGLGPIHPHWRERWSLLGTYDYKWFKTRWPYYPSDFDYRFFQSAPVGQRIAKATGTEEFELVSLHPKHGSLRGRLPGLRARAFAVKTAESGPAFVEIAVKLDTITFAPDDDALHLVWRGHIEVSDDDAPEIERVFATVEPVDGPALTEGEVRARYLAAFAEKPEEPEPAAPPSADDSEAASEDDDEEERKIEALLAAEIAKVEALAPPVDPEAEAAPLPAPNPELVVQAMREAGSTEEEIAEMTAALTAGPETDMPAPPPVDLRELVKRRIAEGESLAALDLSGADLSDLDLSAQSFAGADLSGANLARVDLSGSDAADARFASADLTGANLEGALLSRADLDEANFAGANLRGALLDAAEARGANFKGADLTGAMLAEAVFDGADLSKATFEGASLKEADFTGARLDGANFRNATMTAVRLYDARGEGAVFDGADMTNARADAVALVGCSLKDVTADQSSWERADLTRSTLLGATLVNANLKRATCVKATFSEADLTRARMEKSKLAGASFLRTNLMNAKLDRADLDLADLRGANLHTAKLHRASLKNAKLEGAITTLTSLEDDVVW